ncbi:MAG: hypothetical protein WD512_15315 [Candidatus Paceibacterota bacterium]
MVLIGFILYNVITQSSLFTKSTFLGFNLGGIFQEGKPADGKNPELAMVEQNARTSDGPQYDLTNQVSGEGVQPSEKDSSQLYDYNYQVLPYPQVSSSPQDSYFYSGGVCQSSDPGCYSGSTLQAPDLLPGDHGTNAWEETSPQSAGNITDQNFLESGHHYGINTVGQSLKNANRQLRSDPVIPKVNVSPWQNSTIDGSDGNRKCFEIEA